jgi:hypothetical protein
MRLLLALIVATTAATPLGGQSMPPPPAPDPIFDLFAGRWEGTGTILGQASRAELTVERVLDGRFTRLLWLSHIGAPPKTQRFEGHAYYSRLRPGGLYTATWFDSSGAVRPIRGGPDGDAVVARWGTAETEQGETTYRRLTPDTIEVVDRVLGKNGEWREFGRTTLRRQP